MGDSAAMGIPRRTFLVSSLGSAGLLLPGALRSALGAIPEVWGSSKADPAKRMRIGYLAGSENLSGFAEMTHSPDGYVDALNRCVDPESRSELYRGSIIDAARRSHGDSDFARRGARLRIHGMFGTPGMRLDSLPSLDVYVYAKPFQPVPFHAWGFQAGEAPESGASNEICLPIAPNHGLTVSFDLRGPGIDGSDSGLTPLDPEFYANHVVARFALDHGTGGLKLRRGLYVVAWNGARAISRPSWAGCDISVARIDAQEHSDRPGTLCSRLTQAGSLFAEPLAYVLLSIDHATASQHKYVSDLEAHQCQNLS